MAGDGDEDLEVKEVGREDLPSRNLSPGEARVSEAIRSAGRPLGKSEILARARIDGAAWWSTIGSSSTPEGRRLPVRIDRPTGLPLRTAG
jgi:hypothetical protein